MMSLKNEPFVFLPLALQPIRGCKELSRVLPKRKSKEVGGHWQMSISLLFLYSWG